MGWLGIIFLIGKCIFDDSGFWLVEKLFDWKRMNSKKSCPKGSPNGLQHAKMLHKTYRKLWFLVQKGNQIAPKTLKPPIKPAENNRFLSKRGHDEYSSRRKGKIVLVNQLFLIGICIFDDSSIWLQKRFWKKKSFWKKKESVDWQWFFLIGKCIFDDSGFWLVNEFFERRM